MNVTNWSTITNFETMLVAANANSPFWTAMMFFVSLVAWVLLIPFGVEASLITASFIGFIMGFLLAYMGLVAWTWPLMLLGILIGMLFYVIVWGKGLD